METLPCCRSRAFEAGKTLLLLPCVIPIIAVIFINSNFHGFIVPFVYSCQILHFSTALFVSPIARQLKTWQRTMAQMRGWASTDLIYLFFPLSKLCSSCGAHDMCFVQRVMSLVQDLGNSNNLTSPKILPRLPKCTTYKNN